VIEVTLDHVGQRLDVAVGVHRPLRPGHDAVVVEHPQRTDAHLIWIVIAVEREMPAGVEPATVLRIDLVIPSDRQHLLPLPTFAPPQRPPTRER
jgi:hypothetical protein